MSGENMLLRWVLCLCVILAGYAVIWVGAWHLHNRRGGRLVSLLGIAIGSAGYIIWLWPVFRV